MRRQTKKLALTLLLSAALLSMNMDFVYAEEMGMLDDIAADNTESAEQTEEAAGTDESGAVVESDVQTEAATDITVTATEENTVQQLETDGNTDNTGESGAKETTDDGTATNEESAQQPETDKNAGSGEATDGIAAADGTETEPETPEKVYISQNGEEVVPSTLVGVDYTTVADSYDGMTDVLKQYAVSDTYAKDTIIDSYVDENGSLIMVISQGAETEAEEEKKETGFLEAIADVLHLDAEMGSSSDAPPIDGSFTGWDDIPSSYEFNWNKPDAWVDGVHYEETDSTDVRHEMKLYSDGENVYLKVVFAREFCNGQIGNGNDYQFWIDNQQMAAYQVEWPNGTSLSYNTAEPGVYAVDVRHRDSSYSYVLTDGAVAYYRINEGNLNNELELKIPLSEFVKQNPNINLDNYNVIAFYTPNLMQNKIYTGGASTGAEPFAAAVFTLVPASYVWLKRKDNKEDMAFA